MRNVAMVLGSLAVAGASALEAATFSAARGTHSASIPPITAADNKLVLDATDLRPIVRTPLNAIPDLRLFGSSPNAGLREVVDTDFHDSYSEAVEARRAKRLRAFGVTRATTAGFATRGFKKSVYVRALLCSSSTCARRSLDLLERVHRDQFELVRPLAPRKLGPDAWGHSSSIDVDDVQEFGFHVGNLAFVVRVASIGGDFGSEARALAMELVQRSRNHARR
jgi:hypothetical protein